jgi:hypothetical protein
MKFLVILHQKNIAKYFNNLIILILDFTYFKLTSIHALYILFYPDLAIYCFLDVDSS